MKPDESTIEPAEVRAPARRGLLVFAAAALVAGCKTAPTMGDTQPSQLPVVQMEPATMMPDPKAFDALNRRTRVVVLQPTSSGQTRIPAVDDAALSSIEGLLSAGQVEVVDRRLAGRLSDEIKVIELRGSASGASYGGADVADFAISITMGAATSGSSYAQESNYVDKKTGKTVVLTPAGYIHSGQANMIVKIYELPTLRLINTVNAQGKVSTSPQPNTFTGQSIPLLTQATQAGIANSKVGVLSELMPKGYISEHRKDEKRSIFRALISKRMGAQKGNKVEIVSLTPSEDPLTKRRVIDQQVVATGFVSEVVGEESSWIIVEDKQAAARVRRGDIVRVKHESSFWDTLKIPKPF